MATNNPSRAGILAAIAEWRVNPSAFLQAVGRKPARTVYLVDELGSDSERYPLKAIAIRVLGDQGDGWTTRRYEKALKPELFGFGVITVEDGQVSFWVTEDEEDMDRAEGDSVEVRVQKRLRCRRIVHEFKQGRVLAGTLTCDVCQVSGAILARGEISQKDFPSLFDADHKTPISKGRRRTRKSDLHLLCPNCHRFRHVRERLGPSSPTLQIIAP